VSRGGTLALTLGAVLITGACDDHEFEPPPREERVAAADSVYSPAIFESITWTSSTVRLQAGNLVYADVCRRCHGALGQGGTEYAAVNRLDVPSLVRPEWPYQGDFDALRRFIFTGHEGGMPTWGIGRLSPRQIDAVAAYLQEQLRPEMLAPSAPSIP
jgi:mono/diheme cytochrome c family protein